MLSKLPIYYIQRFVILVMSGLVIFAGVFTFGNAELFDRIFLGVLIILIAYFRDDENITSVFVIIALGRVVEEALWLVQSPDYYFKIIVYTISFWIIYKLRYDVLAKFALLCLSFSIAAEIYWYTSNYERTPSIHWYVILMLQDVVIRHLLFMRPVVFKRWWPKMVSLPLDFQLYNLSGIFVCVHIALISEYFVRHIVHMNSLIIFQLFPYTGQFLACSMLWIILNFSIKRTSLFNA